MTSNEDQVRSWISELSQPRPEFNNQPSCPFAHKAEWELASCLTLAAVLLHLRQTSLPLGKILILKIIGPIPDLEAQIASENTQSLTLRDHIAMISDPSHPVVVDGYQTTQSWSKLVILQRLSELNAVRHWLRKKGYYTNWTSEDLARIGAKP